jgi:hypothetical protein
MYMFHHFEFVSHNNFHFMFHEKSVHMIQHWISPEQIRLLKTVYAVLTRIHDDYPSQSQIFMKTPLQNMV